MFSTGATLIVRIACKADRRFVENLFATQQGVVKGLEGYGDQAPVKNRAT